MRSDKRTEARDVPEPREPVDEPAATWSDGRPAPWEHGPQTPAERAAARRRLDGLAEES